MPMWWIKQSIKRALANQSKTIPVAGCISSIRSAKVRPRLAQMSDELGREPTDDELAERSRIPAIK